MEPTPDKTAEPVRVVNAILTTIGFLASAGTFAWLDENTAGLIISLIAIWAAVFGVNAVYVRGKVTPV
jgi:hypothetical protein